MKHLDLKYNFTPTCHSCMCQTEGKSSSRREIFFNCHPELDSGSIPICSEYDKSKSLTLSSSARFVQHDVVTKEGLL